jgi:hypothetical protein
VHINYAQGIVIGSNSQVTQYFSEQKKDEKK